MKTRADWLGAVIDGKFRILSLLSEGGMGVAYLGEQEELGRKVVLKILHLNLANDAEGKARFIREAQLLGSLQHNHLVQVYSAGVYADEYPYIAMEYLEGRTLEELLRKSGPLDWKKSCRIAMQTCDAMAYCHAAGVIHRDLKPANIILLQNTQTDFVKVIDFGLAKTLDGNKNTLTATGLVVGSPHYMSPEACAGQKPDARSDIYSLACVLYEMLAGRPPYTSESPFELFSAHKELQPVEPSAHVPQGAIPQALDATLLKALEKNSEDRFASMQEFSDNLNAVLSNRELSFDLKELTVYRTKTKKTNSPLQIGFIAALAIICIIAGITFSMRVRSSRNLHVAAKSTSKNKELNDIVSALEQMDNAKKRGDKKKIFDQAKRAMRLFIRELSSSRDQNANFPEELAIMKRMSKDGSLFQSLDTTTYVHNAAKQHLMDWDRSESSENLHNHGQFQILEGRIYEGAGRWGDAIESYSQAALSFSRAKQFDTAKDVIASAESLLKKAMDQGYDSFHGFLRSYVDIGASSMLAFRKDQSLFVSAVKQINQNSEKLSAYEQVRCMSQLGWLCFICGQNDLAANCFRKGIALKAPGPQWFENECIAGLAQVLEKQGQYNEAIKFHALLADRFTATGLISRHTKAQQDVDRLEELVAQQKNAKAN